MGPTPSAMQRAPRRDAQENRERLLAAAAIAVRQRGDKVPMSEIAALAGVGTGTLYRHFATREQLLEALTVRAFSIVLSRVRELSDAPGPAIEAIGSFFLDTIRHRDDLILPLHGGPGELGPEAKRLQAEIRVVLGKLLARGRTDGTIRADVTPRDIVIAGAQLAQPLAHIADWDRVSRRQARIYLDGLRPRPVARGGGKPR